MMRAPRARTRPRLLPTRVVILVHGAARHSPPGLKETPVAELDAVLLVQPEQVAEMITAAIALSRTTAQTDLHLRPARKAEARV